MRSWPYGARRSPTRMMPSARSGRARACRCGWTQLGPGIQARAGVLTGEAAVTLGATNQGMVAGDLVNTAARCKAAASPGTVLVGEATKRVDLERRSSIEPAGEHDAQGQGRLRSPAWRALRVVAELGGQEQRRRRSRRRSSGATTSCGCSRTCSTRRAARQRTRLVFDHAAPRGHRQEPPGVGASKYIDGLVENVCWHDGRSPAYGEGITFWALGEMVRDEPDWPRATTRRRHATRMAAPSREWVTDPEEQRWIESAAADSARGRADPGGSEQLFAAWRTFFERIGAQGTVTLVFEDLHYADPGTARLHRAPARLEPRAARSTSSPWPGRSCSRDAPTGARGKRNFTLDVRSSRWLSPHMRELLGGPGARAARDCSRDDRRAGPTASRCTPWRRCACWSPTASLSARRRRRLRAGRRPERAGRA